METIANAEKSSIKLTMDDGTWYLYEQADGEESISYTDSTGAAKTMTEEEVNQDIFEKMGIENVPNVPDMPLE